MRLILTYILTFVVFCSNAQNISLENLEFLNQVTEHYASITSFNYEVQMKAFNGKELITELNGRSIKKGKLYRIDAFNSTTIVNDSFFCFVDYYEETINLERFELDYFESENLIPHKIVMNQEVLDKYNVVSKKQGNSLFLTLYDYDNYDEVTISYNLKTYELESLNYISYPENQVFTGTSNLMVTYESLPFEKEDYFSLTEFLIKENDEWIVSENYREFDLQKKVNK